MLEKGLDLAASLVELAVVFFQSATSYLMGVVSNPVLLERHVEFLSGQTWQTWHCEGLDAFLVTDAGAFK